jgi:hypothetical protein
MNAILFSLLLALGAQDVQTAPRPTTFLYVKTTPPGAEIRLDGKPLGKSNRLFDVSPGEYDLSLLMDGRMSDNRTIEIRPGEITRIEVTIKLQADQRAPGRHGPADNAPSDVAETETNDASPMRVWHSAAGGLSVKGELIDVRDGKVILRKSDRSHVTVPLKQLSLADVRYVAKVIKAAEAGITDPNPDASAGEKIDAAAASPPVAASEIDFQKLRYRWKKGQSYVYRVKIKGDRGYYSEYYAGDVTYTVKSIEPDGAVLGMSANMTRGDRLEPVDVFVIASPADPMGPFGSNGPFGPNGPPGPTIGPPPGFGPFGRSTRFRTTTRTGKDLAITVDALGRVEHIEGDAQLPFLLGDLSQLMIEVLPDAKKTAWTVANDTGVSVIGTYYPYYRFWGSGYHEGVPAIEKCVYTIREHTGRQVTIAKQYELTSGAASVSGKPRFEATGDGTFVFDVERGLTASMDFRMRVAVHEGIRTEESPVRITYRLLTEEEIATAKKEAEETKKKEELAKKEKLRPLTDQEIETTLADLTSGETERITASAKLLAEKKPITPNPKIAQALEPLMLTGDDVGVRANAANAMKNWSTPENVPALLKALADDWGPVQSAAMEALAKHKVKGAIKPVAHLLHNGHVRRSALQFLKTMGADAEDDILAQLIASSDDWVRADVCKLLGEIGTKKSLPELEKAVMDESWMVNGNARKALTQIKNREGMKPP